MVNYRYHLSTRPKKYVCPECGKKTFTPYVDENEEPADVERFGRCDRENNCGFICYPKGGDYVPSFDDLHKRREFKPKQITYLQQAHVSHTEKDEPRAKNPLFVFLCDVTQDPDAVLQAWKRYHVGTDNKQPSFTIFWQIDDLGRVRTGHFMQYRPDGHRNKENPYSQNWAHRKLQRAGLLDEQAEVEQCLFGLQLLNEPDAEGKPVYLFESEKTAIVASLFHPDALCMATAGCGSFNTSKLKALAGRNVVYFPDDDQAGGKWNARTADELKESCGLSSLTRSWWICNVDYDFTPRTGLDYCDHLLNLLAIEREKPTTEEEPDPDADFYFQEPEPKDQVQPTVEPTPEPEQPKPTEPRAHKYPNTVAEFIASFPETDDVPF